MLFNSIRDILYHLDPAPYGSFMMFIYDFHSYKYYNVLHVLVNRIFYFK